MKRIMIKKFFSFLIGFWMLFCAHSFGAGRVIDLRCRSMVNPVGIESPDFSWQLQNAAIGARQTGREIQIASSLMKLNSGCADVWKSGLQTSSEQLHVKPSGVCFQDGVEYWWRVRVREGNGEMTSWSNPATFMMGLSDSSWCARWITVDWNQCRSLPYLRKEFYVKEMPVRAVVYVCALGCGDLYVNGALNDSSRILDPAQTNYEQYALYSSFDITSKLVVGNNCMGVMLGDGWYHQNRMYSPAFVYGKPKMRLQLVLTYADGHRENVISDPSWQWTEGPVVNSNIFAGETYDANREIPDWSRAGGDHAHWNAAIETNEALPPSLRPQMMDPIRLLDRVKPKQIWRDRNGNWVIDFGENIAAVPRLCVSLPQGMTLTLRMGEYLAADSTVDFSTTGVAVTGVCQTDIYTCSGHSPEIWTPRFTYHGFRYAELSGFSDCPDKSMVEAVVTRTAVPETGHFSCDNAQLNKLHELALRTFYSNIHGIPTDCPHRERCGWLGDAHTVAPYESMNADMENFFLKYMDDVNSSGSKFEKNTLFHKLYNSIFYSADKPVGISYMIAPGRRQCGVASPDWGTAQVQIPWDLYWYYGNKESLVKSYDYMKVWTNHISKLSENFIVPYGLGDWCPPGGNKKIDCPVPLSSTAFHYKDVCLMEKTARLLGRKGDAAFYKALKPKISNAFVHKFYDAAHHTFGSQTANAMALDFGLVPAGDEEAVAASIVRNADEQHDGFIHVGIFGMARIAQTLSDYGHAADAYRFFTKQGENSFAWMWTAQHATTLWETLPTASDPITMKAAHAGSLNHPMQGGYDTWFYQNIAGLRPIEAGYRKLQFELPLIPGLHQAAASIHTPYGDAASSWTNVDGKISWNLTIPANTSGEVILPSTKHVTINGTEISNLKYIHLLRTKSNEKVYAFPSGSFNLVAE